jgi:hypothetical protein
MWEPRGVAPLVVAPPAPLVMARCWTMYGNPVGPLWDPSATLPGPPALTQNMENTVENVHSLVARLRALYACGAVVLPCLSGGYHPRWRPRSRCAGM